MIKNDNYKFKKIRLIVYERKINYLCYKCFKLYLKLCFLLLSFNHLNVKTNFLTTDYLFHFLLLIILQT
jgi:hypothetical protein